MSKLGFASVSSLQLDRGAAALFLREQQMARRQLHLKQR